MNFYEYIHDAYIFNQRVQINFTIGYISFLGLYE